MIKLKNAEEALETFEAAAIKHAEATEQGDFKTANRSYATITKVIAFLKERNEICRLFPFLNHPSDGVKCWAATYLLPTEELGAIRTLKEIAKGSGIYSLTAETTLSEWEKGNLKF